MVEGNGNSFGIAFSNVPLLNLRWEFREFFERAHSKGFLNQSNPAGRPLETRYFIWLGMRDACASMMMTRSIIGLEAYLLYAAQTEGMIRGLSTEKLKKAVANPFTLGRSAVRNYFNRLPALIAPHLAMIEQDATLWNNTVTFDREVRNPLMHGQQFSNIREERFADLFDLLADIYEWLDSWHSPDNLLPGMSEAVRLR